MPAALALANAEEQCCRRRIDGAEMHTTDASAGPDILVAACGRTALPSKRLNATSEPCQPRSATDPYSERSERLRVSAYFAGEHPTVRANAVLNALAEL